MPPSTVPRGFSLKEAAVLAGVPESHIRKAIEARTIMPRVTRVGRVQRYGFRGRDLLYLSLIHDFPLPLTPQDKRNLWDLIGGQQTHSGHWRRDDRDVVITEGNVVLRVDVRPLKARLIERLNAFRAGRRRIVSDPAILSGEPVFEGTRIPLAHIAGLLRRGVPLDEIREDYSALGEADLTYASLVARMKPDPGRPRKALRLVRAARPRPQGATALTSDRSAWAHAAPD
jgi:uncharacterized protein (DUF433 family)